ncbi:MAG: hypothetical protein QNJ35_07675 [Paracoccaceae bacterium]|nr:hypothetical protein [Paracoccaceae bacterium]
MTDLPIAPAAPKLAEPKTPELKGSLQRISRWFWKVAEDTKEMDTKPYDGIL